MSSPEAHATMNPPLPSGEIRAGAEYSAQYEGRPEICIPLSPQSLLPDASKHCARITFFPSSTQFQTKAEAPGSSVIVA